MGTENIKIDYDWLETQDDLRIGTFNFFAGYEAKPETDPRDFDHFDFVYDQRKPCRMVSALLLTHIAAQCDYVVTNKPHPTVQPRPPRGKFHIKIAADNSWMVHVEEYNLPQLEQQIRPRYLGTIMRRKPEKRFKKERMRDAMLRCGLEEMDA